MHVYDVAIVGAGPAGASLALYLMDGGLDIIIFDKRRFPREKICGDLVGPWAVDALKQFVPMVRLNQILKSPVNGFRFSSPNGDFFDVSIKGHKNLESYFIPRLIMDYELVKVVEASGAQLHTGFKVGKVQRESLMKWRISGKDSNGAEKEFQSRIVVAADGFPSTVLRCMGIRHNPPAHQAVCVRAYAKGIEPCGGLAEMHYLEEIYPGYFWIFPVGENRFNIGLGMRRSLRRRKNVPLTDLFMEVIKSKEILKYRLKNAEIISRPMGGVVPLGSFHPRSPYCDLILVGDACSLCDPFTGEGIAYAVRSAKLASEAIKDFAISFLQVALKNYGKNLENDFKKRFSASRKISFLAGRKFLLNNIISQAGQDSKVKEALEQAIIHGKPSKAISPIFLLKTVFKSL